MRGAPADAGGHGPRAIDPGAMSASPTLALACELIRRVSVTPEDAGCQAILAGRLAPLGFGVESMRFAEVDNLWARRGTADSVARAAGTYRCGAPGPCSNGAVHRSSRRSATDISTGAAPRT